MDTVTLRAHFDGKQIVLDEPFKLEPNAELIVTVVPRSCDEEREIGCGSPSKAWRGLTAMMSPSTQATRSAR